MFGVGGGEIVFIILIALMLFGSDKIPDIARTLGKGMAQLKNATNDIKHEIQKSAEDTGISTISNPLEELDVTKSITQEIDQFKEGMTNIEGPIKRSR